MRLFPPRFRIGRRWVGEGAPCLIVAEVGLNHNGDFALARRSIHAAARAGADAVKFQNYRTEDFLSDRTLTYTYLSRGRRVTESQWEMFKRCEAPREWWPKVRDLCRKAGVLFFSTPTSEEGVEDLVRWGAPALKNGSDYLTHIPLLRRMSGTGLPVLASTGMAEQIEVDHAVAAVRAGKSPLLLLHCTSAYPTPLDQVNLKRLVTLRNRYRLPVGFSDHTEGWEAAVQAVSLGACLVEKHFTLDHRLPGPDHWFSSGPDDFGLLVQAIRRAERRLGEASLRPSRAEHAGRRNFRVSAVASRPLSVGSALSRADVAFRRPGMGFMAWDLPRYLGRRLTRPAAAGLPLSPGLFGERKRR